MLGTMSQPLPLDLPHVGGYDTRYDVYFGQDSNAEASELNSVIPARHAELLVAAQRVTTAEDWLTSVAAGPATAESAEAMVRAMELLALSRRAFVQLAKDYNRRIGHYTALSRPGELPTTRLVAMLILTNSTASRSPIAPRQLGPRSEIDSPTTSAEEDWQRPSLAAGRGIVDEQVSPASAYDNSVSETERTAEALSAAEIAFR